MALQHALCMLLLAWKMLARTDLCWVGQVTIQILLTLACGHPCGILNSVCSINYKASPQKVHVQPLDPPPLCILLFCLTDSLCTFWLRLVSWYWEECNYNCFLVWLINALPKWWGTLICCDEDVGILTRSLHLASVLSLMEIMCYSQVAAKVLCTELETWGPGFGQVCSA